MKVQILLFILFLLAQGKYIRTTLTMTRNNNWQYVSKFGMDIGVGDFSMKARLLRVTKEFEGKKHNLQFSIFIDEEWEQDLSSLSCTEKNKRAKLTYDLALPLDGQFSGDIVGELSQSVRPHVWYFVISDCNNLLNDHARVKVEITMRNEGRNHLSVEQMGLKSIYLVLAVIFLLGLGANILKLIKYFRKEEEVQLTMVWLNMAIFFQFLSMIVSYFNLTIYESNGRGLGALDFIEQALILVSQLTITCLLIIIAEGWTIQYSDFPNADIYIPIILIVTFLHLVVLGLGKISDDSSYKFSEYEGIAGLALIILRFCMFGWFLYNAKYLFSLTKAQKSIQFIYKFTVASSVYFLSMPILVIASKFFALYVRGKFIIGGTLFMQMATFLFLSIIFSTKGEYYRISSMSAVLPGAKIHSY
ncbi:unnamed protein product [Blepharisma stoltei]|uniref:GPR180/TMEM145 transmembrane domain-containing protein n=1 Tax=Blepharisma stoltei TaxID=1481888 RepID=A0AAU9J1X6_9CILI|nr:unnamed protein product [Blepharisma stoltei]